MSIQPSHPQIYIRNINQFCEYVLKNKNNISCKFFADRLGQIERSYIARHQEDVFCKDADLFLDKLVEERGFDFAGIVTSILCKINAENPQKLEYFAKRGYEVSQMNGDYVHMMARLNELRKIYINCKDRLFDYIQVLYKQEKCLKKITKTYLETAKTFRTVSRELAPQETYERMLAYVQTEIAKLTRKKHPHDALKKLHSALEIFQRQQNLQSVVYINRLIKEIEKGLLLSEKV